MNAPCHPASPAPAAPYTDPEPPLILPLDAIQSEHLALVGAKAFNLGRLKALNLPVPAGFCITTAAYECCIVGKQRTKINSALRRQIQAAYRQLGDQRQPVTVAVRSSAVEEDSHEASWAGIFQTILNVTGSDDLINAVQTCFDSLHSNTANQFRSGQSSVQQQFPPRMAVIVQVQVPASAAGVLFTRNPLNGNADQVCINSVLGLGEPLVSGDLCGDRFVLDKDNRTVEQQLTEQRFRLTAHGQHPLPRHLQLSPSLGSDQLQRLATLGRTVAKAFADAQDIEFATEGEQCWILQSRPIPVPRDTSDPMDSLGLQLEDYIKREQHKLQQRMQQLRQQQVLSPGASVLSNSNISELLPTPTPMSFGLFNEIFARRGGAIPRGRRELGYTLAEDGTEHLFCLVAGQPYFHVEIDAATFQPAQLRPLESILEEIRQQPQRANYPEFGLYRQFLSLEACQQQFGALDGERRYQAHQAFYGQQIGCAERYLSRYRHHVEPELIGYIDAQRQVDLRSKSAEELVSLIHAWIEHLKRDSCYHFVIAARLGFYFAESVRHRLHALLGDCPEAERNLLMTRLLQALPGSRINEQSFDLHALQSGQLSPGHYLARYGHLATNELEISLPRHAERSLDPHRLSMPISGHSVEDNPLDQFRMQMRQRKAAECRLRKQLAFADPQPVAELFRDLRLARRFLPLRETIKFYYTAEYALIRQALLRLAELSALQQDEIFYLYPDELARCVDQPTSLKPLVKLRRQERLLALRLAEVRPLPDVLFNGQIDTPTTTPAMRSALQSQQPGKTRLDGTPLASGRRAGRVLLIDTEIADVTRLIGQVREQDIIVTRSANLGLAPLLRKVAGLVVEVGGFLAHGACQAREAGIPAIVLPNARKRLQQGQRLVLDGSQGLVEL